MHCVCKNSSDSRSRVSGFNPNEHRVVLLSKTLYLHCLELISTQEDLCVILRKNEDVAGFVWAGSYTDVTFYKITAI